MKKIVRLTESDLIKVVQKVIKEQSNVLQGWDKLKVGQSIKLKNDRDGVVSSWSVAKTSPNPGPNGDGTKLFLYPLDEKARLLTPEEIQVSFYPQEMKVSLPGGMNTIVTDGVAKKLPAKPDQKKPPPEQKKDLDKEGFYTLYNETGGSKGIYVRKQGITMTHSVPRDGSPPLCKIEGTASDGQKIVLYLVCRPSGAQHLYLVMLGPSESKLRVKSDELVDDINCPCPQG